MLTLSHHRKCLRFRREVMAKSYILALTALAMFCAPGLGSTGASAAGIEMHGFSGIHPTFHAPSGKGSSFESRSFAGREGHDDRRGDRRDDHHGFSDGRDHHDHAFGEHDSRTATWSRSTKGSATSGAGAGKGWNQISNKSGGNGNSGGINNPTEAGWNRVKNTNTATVTNNPI
jgi:hypothetical protein